MNTVLLKQWMSEHNLRPEDLASKLNVSYSTVRNLLAGKRPQRITTVALAGLIGVPVEQLQAEIKVTPGGRKAAG